MPETTVLFERLAVALAIGLLIGIERGWKARELAPGERVAGVRTFGVTGFLGGLAAILTLETSAATLAAILIGLTGMLALNHWFALKQGDADFGSTTLVAALATFGLGAMAGFGALAVAGAGAVVLAVVLSVKKELHGFVARLDQSEILAGLELLAISVVLLPVLPDASYGPLDAINPYQIWWMVVLIAGLSFFGYVAIRAAGTAHGVMLTGLIGGFASSTVTALNMGRMARQPTDGEGEADRDALLAAGACAAMATMFPRVVVIVAAIAPTTGLALAWALVPACLALLGNVALRWRRAATVSGGASVQQRKPFELRVALEFAVILTAIMFAVEAARVWLGDSGLFVLAFLAGLFDVDAISLSYAQMATDGTVAPAVVVVALCLGVLANMLVKPFLVVSLGAPRMAMHLLLPLLAATLAAIVGLVAGHALGLAPFDLALPWKAA